MKNNILLISVKTIKEKSLINDNVGEEYILPSIIFAQEIELQQLIGSGLYNKLCQLVNDGTISGADNAKYKTLLDGYITDFLLWQTVSEIQIPLSLKTTNSGTIQNTDNNKQPISKTNVGYMAQYYKDKANFYAKNLKRYLCKNSSKYPEYINNDVDVYTSTPDYSNIYLD